MRCARFSLSRSRGRKSVRGKSRPRSRSTRGEKKNGYGIGTVGRSSTGNSKQAQGRSKSRDRPRMKQERGASAEVRDDQLRQPGGRDERHRSKSRGRRDDRERGGVGGDDRQGRDENRHRSNSRGARRDDRDRRGGMGDDRDRRGGPGGDRDRRGSLVDERWIGRGRNDVRGDRRRSRDGGRRSRSRGRRSMSRRRNGGDRSPRRKGEKGETDNVFGEFGPLAEPPKEEEPLIVPVDENLSAIVQMYNNLRIRPAGPWLPQLIVDACLRLVGPKGGHCYIGTVAKQLRIPADALTTHFCVQGPFIVLRPDEMEKAASLPPLPVQPAPGSQPEMTQKQGRFQSPEKEREHRR